MVVGISNSFYVVFGPSLTPIPNFIQIGRKTQKLKIFTIGRLWLVGLVGRKMAVGISKSFYVVFAPLLTPIPNFIQIGQKTQKFERGIQLASPLLTAHSMSDFVFMNVDLKRAVFLLRRCIKTNNVF